MKYRTMACCAALVFLSVGCGEDQDSGSESSSRTQYPAPDDATSDATSNTTAGAEYAPESTAPGAINPVTDAAEDALSTFAMDVDTGSYTLARASLEAGVVPDPANVRTEEFVNSFDQDYDQPEDGPLAVTVDATSAPFLDDDARVVRVGVQGRSLDDEQRRDANLTFVIDISGSMADPNKLEAVRPALRGLVEALRPTDRVGIVVYSDSTRVLLSSTPVSDRRIIDDAIDELQPEGATFVEAGLELGYEQAQLAYDSERINRVILLSDGVANVGATGPEAILEIIGDGARDGIDLVTVGFGLGEYNDSLMEQLADQGDGFYAYVDSEREAVRLFSHDLTGTLQTIAREAKVQVEFNPETVRTYRLVGFENRQVADDDFRDDSVDGGEIGSGHTVTALYEVTLVEGADTASDAWVARATVRWLHPDTREPSETGARLDAQDVSQRFGDAPARLQQDILVAAFAERLRGSGWSDLLSLRSLSENLHLLAERLDDSQLQELADLVDVRRDLDD